MIKPLKNSLKHSNIFIGKNEYVKGKSLKLQKQYTLLIMYRIRHKRL